MQGGVSVMSGVGKKQGFTLIELLIVVAIIAILAAIAVPNFLEAQARSKIAQTKANMKTIVLGIEMYELDHGRVLTLWQRDTDPRRATMSFWLDTTLPIPTYGHYLTTPIAYLSSIPHDYFMSRMMTNSMGIKGTRTSVMMHSKSRDLPAFVLWSPWRWYWSLESIGPNLMWWSDPALGNSILDAIFYDPTNGTISSGGIWYHDMWGFGAGYGAPPRP